MKSKLEEDWITAKKHHVSIQTVTKSVHEEKIRIAYEQTERIDIQIRALDDFVTRARSHNAQHHDVHSRFFKSLSKTVKASYGSISGQLARTYERSKSLGDDMSEKQKLLGEALAALDSTLRRSLSDFCANISRITLQEYEPTGETPQMMQYKYHTELPCNEPYENLVAAVRSLSPLTISPSNSTVFSSSILDANDESVKPRPIVTRFSASLPPRKFSQTLPGLREINVNLLGSFCNSTPGVGTANLSASAFADNTVPLFGRSIS